MTAAPTHGTQSLGRRYSSDLQPDDRCLTGESGVGSEMLKGGDGGLTMICEFGMRDSMNVVWSGGWREEPIYRR